MPWAAPTHGHAQREARKAEMQRERDAQRGTPSERGYGKAWQPIRAAVLMRDGYKCVRCGALVGHRKGDAHVDHIRSKARGGTDDMANLQTLCRPCHARKTNTEDGGGWQHG